MGRMYTAPLVVAAHTAQVDYFELLAAAEKPIALHAFELGQTTELGDAADETITASLKRITGAPTSGSGGTTATSVPTTPNDTAASATLETGNTTKLTGGTSAVLATIPWNVRAGYLWVPPPEGRIIIAGGTRLVLEETATPADSVTGPIGWILYEELV